MLGELGEGSPQRSHQVRAGVGGEGRKELL